MAERKEKARRRAARHAALFSKKKSSAMGFSPVFANSKILAPCAAICLGSAPLAAQAHVVLDLMPQFTLPVASDTLKYGFGGTAKLEMKPKASLGFFAEGGYQTIGLNAEGLDNINVLNGSLGIALHHSFTDNLLLNADVLAGVYRASGLSSTITGLSGGIRLGLTYRMNPVLGATANAGYMHMANTPSDFLHGATAAAGLSIDLTEAFNNKAAAKAELTSVLPVFPVLYSWYENNSFAKVKVTNQEEGSITDVTVSFYLPQYMTQENTCVHKDTVERGESFDANLTAFFNERMLELTERVDTQALVKVSYRFLGQMREHEFPVTIPVYNRNSMSWDDDRRAAVFVSSKDPAALLLSKYITSVVRDRIRSGVNENIQYVMGLFETLHTFGVNYVVDPSSAYADNVGSTSVDFLQFPFQTLTYRGGDCDDLSILNCSLIEAVGIESAFITVPGHIFIAFDSGMTEAEARRISPDLSEFALQNGKIWIPLEITLTKDRFAKAWSVGAHEWKAANLQGKAKLYPMHDSWKLYKPVSVPGAVANFTLPERTEIAMTFDGSIDTWIQEQITPQILEYRALLAKGEKPFVRNELGVLYGSYGLLDQADEQFAVARSSNYIPAVINLGTVNFNNQDYTKALELYKTALKYQSDDPIALLGAARSLYELDRYADSDVYYEKLCKNDPALASQYGYLGSFSDTRGRSYSLADRLANTTWSDPDAAKVAALTNPVQQAPANAWKETAPAVNTTQSLASVVVPAPVATESAVSASTSADDSAFASAADDATAGWSVASASAPATTAPATTAPAASVSVATAPAIVEALASSTTPAANAPAVSAATQTAAVPVLLSGSGLSDQIGFYKPERLPAKGSASEKESSAVSAADTVRSSQTDDGEGTAKPETLVDSAALAAASIEADGASFVSAYTAEPIEDIKVAAPDGSITKAAADYILNPLTAGKAEQKNAVASAKAVRKTPFNRAAKALNAAAESAPSPRREKRSSQKSVSSPATATPAAAVSASHSSVLAGIIAAIAAAVVAAIGVAALIIKRKNKSQK
jgi:tetratricopeptide (TPR) repeat protein